MIHVFALIKDKWLKFLNQDEGDLDWQEIEIPKSDLVVDYSPTDKLETGQWFKLTDFNNREFSNKFCSKKDIDTVDYEKIQSSDNHAYSNIKALTFRFKEKEIIGFQNIAPKKNISNKFILSRLLRDEPTIENIHDGVIIEKHMDALYDQNEDVLYFKKISNLTQIFPGIELLERQANEEELRKFFKDICGTFCTLINDSFISKITLTNRKNIAQLIDNNIASLTNKQKKEQVEYYQEEGFIDLHKENDKFLMNNNKDVSKLINALNEKYYNTRFRNEKREVSGYRTINK